MQTLRSAMQFDSPEVLIAKARSQIESTPQTKLYECRNEWNKSLSESQETNKNDDQKYNAALLISNLRYQTPMTKNDDQKARNKKCCFSPGTFSLEFLLPKEAQNHQLGSLDSTRGRSCGRFCLGRQFEWYLGIKVLGIWVRFEAQIILFNDWHLEMPSKIFRHQHERSGKCQKRVTWLEKR